ncbi:MAG: hypothetical protein PWQ97_472 [Tepidanaerobacteraceae bacterium]|nr:hypothetical protein [Tepidanaerobacteraceae bacterium]
MIAVECSVYIDDKGNEFFVSDGLSMGEYRGTFIRNPSGKTHRVKSRYMPMVRSAAKAQKNLDSYAKRHGLQKKVQEGDKGE